MTHMKFIKFYECNECGYLSYTRTDVLDDREIEEAKRGSHRMIHTRSKANSPPTGEPIPLCGNLVLQCTYRLDEIFRSG